MEGAELLLGFLLIWIAYRWPSPKVLLFGCLGIIVFLCLVSVILFSEFDYWLNAIPLLGAVFIHQLYDHAKQYRKLSADAQRRVASPTVPLPSLNSPTSRPSRPPQE